MEGNAYEQGLSRLLAHSNLAAATTSSHNQLPGVPSPLLPPEKHIGVSCASELSLPFFMVKLFKYHIWGSEVLFSSIFHSTRRFCGLASKSKQFLRENVFTTASDQLNRHQSFLLQASWAGFPSHWHSSNNAARQPQPPDATL